MAPLRVCCTSASCLLTRQSESQQERNEEGPGNCPGLLRELIRFSFEEVLAAQAALVVPAFGASVQRHFLFGLLPFRPGNR